MQKRPALASTYVMRGRDLTEREQDIETLKPYLTNGLMGIKRLKEHLFKQGGQEQVSKFTADIEGLTSERPLQAGFKRIFEIVEDFIDAENPPQVILRINLLDEMKRLTTFEGYIAYQVKHFFRPPPASYCGTFAPVSFTINPAVCTSNVYPSMKTPTGNRQHRRSKA